MRVEVQEEALKGKLKKETDSAKTLQNEVKRLHKEFGLFYESTLFILSIKLLFHSLTS